MTKRNLLLSGALVISLAGGSTMLYAGSKNSEREAYRAAHQKDVAAMVQKLKACPDKNDPLCLSPAQKNKLSLAANTSEKLGDFEKAGIIYAKLGRDDDAQKMAKSCEAAGNKEGQGRITEALKVRADALILSAESQ
ncbi:hypothetical protein H0O00_05195 [Candidatus Micrarchaeota archaeon]|nr:hypothetical protein [Candidatus Micrarchaeota archaeon]